MVETTVVRSVRMPGTHWAFVVQRAKQLGINPNAWMTRMVRRQMDGNHEQGKAAQPTGKQAEPRGAAPAGTQPTYGPLSPKPGSRLKNR